MDHAPHLSVPASITPTSKPAGAGAAQFINNLTPTQLQHLRLTIPAAHVPDRYSQFLEGPRQTPVPHKFIFDALDSESRRLRHQTGRLGERQHVRAQSEVNVGEGKTESARSSVDLKEITLEKVKVAVDVVEWRFYLVGCCLCLLNLVAAFDATALSIALPVRFHHASLISQAVLTVYRRYPSTSTAPPLMPSGLVSLSWYLLP
jgi:hypothetical protein